MRAILLLAALMMMLPAAAGQSAPATCGPISYTGGVKVPADIAPGGEGDVTLTVANGNGFQAVDVVVSASTTSDGWSLAANEKSISIPVSSSAPATFHVLVAKTAKGDGTLNFSATGTCAAPGGSACPAPFAAQCTTTIITTSGVVKLGATGGFGFPGFDNLDFPIEYVVLGVVVIGLAIAIPLMVRKRKPALVADCPEPLKMVRPGRGTSFPIDIRNPGADALTAQFEVGPVPEGWSAFMPLPEVQLAPKESRSLWLMVRSPATAESGARADVTLRLRNAKRPEVATSVKVRAEVDPNAAEGGPKTG